MDTERIPIPTTRLIEILDTDQTHDGAADAAERLRSDPRETFEAHELNLESIKRIMTIRQQHLRRIGKTITGFDDFVASLATWTGPLHLVVVTNAADADIGIYADVHRAALAGCIVSTPAWVRPDGDPY